MLDLTSYIVVKQKNSYLRDAKFHGNLYDIFICNWLQGLSFELTYYMNKVFSIRNGGLYGIQLYFNQYDDRLKKIIIYTSRCQIYQIKN